MKVLRTIVLEGERPMSWNTLYSGKHWSVRKHEARRVHALVRAMLDPSDTPFEFPVAIRMIAYFKGRIQDSCNMCPKLYTDGLLATGDYAHGHRSLLWDDDMRYVTQTTTVPKRDKDNPRVVIEILESNE